ncbi:thioredoxin-like protein yls8 [Quercus suber]|uniref:Thioredoxin-like protein yls8 n=1 Tax=Quercus suber TaxID=58331 RepID=A0AAW0JKU0_QUESU
MTFYSRSSHSCTLEENNTVESKHKGMRGGGISYIGELIFYSLLIFSLSLSLSGAELCTLSVSRSSLCSLPPEFAFSISETLSSPQRKGSSSETWSFLLSLLTDFRGNLSNTPQNLEVERMSSYLLTVLTKKQEVDTIIRDTIDKVLVLRFGRASDPVCLQLDDVLSKSAREVSKFASVALVDIDSNEIQVYVKYFDITFIPSTECRSH